MARAQCVAPLPNTLYQWYCPVGRHTAVAPLTAASALVVSLCSEAPQPLLRGATASGPQLSTAGNSTRVSSHLLLGGHTCNPELGQGPLWSGFQCSAPLLTALSQRCSPVGRLAFGTPPPVCPLPLYGLMAPMLNPAVTSGVSSTPMVCGSCWCGYCKRFF